MIFTAESIANRKNKVAQSFLSALGNEDTVLVFSGQPIQKPGGHDQTYPFLPHPDYFWLTGFRRPHGVSAFTKADGWIDFILPVSRQEKIWEGAGLSLPGRDISGLDEWIKKRSSGKIFLLGQYQQSPYHSKVSEEERMVISELMNEVRRIKDSEEIALVKSIAQLANEGYKKVRSIIRPGLTEKDIQIEYETAVLKAGSEKFPYNTIVGAGTNSAILHAGPSSRILKDGEHVLIDAGADLSDYCVDITRVIAANGKFNDRLKAVSDIVAAAQAKSISLCTPGIKWSEVHLASARVMAQGLKDLNVLTVSADQALESGAIAVFFPHGVGHMVGLKVRDVGAPPVIHPKNYAGARLRTDMTLKAGHLMTVEPGMYFIEALLHDDETRSKFKEMINWNEAQKWMDFGGVRIEDDIHITENGPINLTAIVEK